jgi:hypothetical protein
MHMYVACLSVNLCMKIKCVCLSRSGLQSICFSHNVKSGRPNPTSWCVSCVLVYKCEVFVCMSVLDSLRPYTHTCTCSTCTRAHHHTIRTQCIRSRIDSAGFIQVNVHVYVYMCMYMHIYTYTHTYMYIRINTVYIHLCTYIYIHAYTYSHAYTYIHTYLLTYWYICTHAW